MLAVWIGLNPCTDMTPANFLSALGEDLVEMSEGTKGKTI